MLVQRMIRVAQLDNTVFDEVEKDTNATTEALYVVLIVAAATGFSGAMTQLFSGRPGQIIPSLLGGLIAAVIGWIVWSYVTYFVGTKMFNGTATPGEMMRCIGFAQTPGVLRVAGFIPVIGGIIGLIAAIWSLVTAVIAIKEALDFDLSKAILTAVVGWIGMILIFLLLALFGLGSFLSVM